MAGNVQTTLNLTAEADNVLASGQPSGAITAARLRQLMEDVIVSYLNLPGSVTLASSPSYDNDTAAGTGGVPVGGIYRNGNFLMIRLS